MKLFIQYLTSMLRMMIYLEQKVKGKKKKTCEYDFKNFHSDQEDLQIKGLIEANKESRHLENFLPVQDDLGKFCERVVK